MPHRSSDFIACWDVATCMPAGPSLALLRAGRLLRRGTDDMAERAGRGPYLYLPPTRYRGTDGLRHALCLQSWLPACRRRFAPATLTSAVATRFVPAKFSPPSGAVAVRVYAVIYSCLHAFRAFVRGVAGSRLYLNQRRLFTLLLPIMPACLCHVLLPDFLYGCACTFPFPLMYYPCLCLCSSSVPCLPPPPVCLCSPVYSCLPLFYSVPFLHYHACHTFLLPFACPHTTVCFPCPCISCTMYFHVPSVFGT